jgi:hypothetical protein
MEKTYNGWTNYETWRVNLEVFDDLDPLEYFDLKQEPYDLGQDLKGFAEHVIDNGISEGLAVDYAMAFLSNVNFREIAKHMIEAYAESEA